MKPGSFRQSQNGPAGAKKFFMWGMIVSDCYGVYYIPWTGLDEYAMWNPNDRDSCGPCYLLCDLSGDGKPGQFTGE
jgi:hypothetical protein